MLAATFFGMAATFDATWALAAHRFRQALAVRGVLRNRLTGGLLVSAGVGLAFARKA
jgi:threonine/homoserine/homoserine lactone efflux protein